MLIYLAVEAESSGKRAGALLALVVMLIMYAILLRILHPRILLVLAAVALLAVLARWASEKPREAFK